MYTKEKNKQTNKMKKALQTNSRYLKRYMNIFQGVCVLRDTAGILQQTLVTDNLCKYYIKVELVSCFDR